MRKIHKLLKESDILLHAKHPGCGFWESPKGDILVVQNPSVKDLVEQAEVIMNHDYRLSGGIQLIRRDDGDFNACATFLAIIK